MSLKHGRRNPRSGLASGFDAVLHQLVAERSWRDSIFTCCFALEEVHGACATLETSCFIASSPPADICRRRHRDSHISAQSQRSLWDVLHDLHMLFGDHRSQIQVFFSNVSHWRIQELFNGALLSVLLVENTELMIKSSRVTTFAASLLHHTVDTCLTNLKVHHGSESVPAEQDVVCASGAESLPALRDFETYLRLRSHPSSLASTASIHDLRPRGRSAARKTSTSSTSSSQCRRNSTKSAYFKMTSVMCCSLQPCGRGWRCQSSPLVPAKKPQPPPYRPVTQDRHSQAPPRGAAEQI